uniref:AAA domain-containing protein n=1 Tax=Steinernema glaseri TaxID=37863 RepID=A0A1I7ZW85_9BILA
MKQGTPLLIDEISLAADSVLERLNPLLESSRSLYLTDAGTNAEAVSSAPGFQVVATMNPGGDYGKKELSKALRNRFTEFWCAGDLTGEDLSKIIQKRLRASSTDVTSVAAAIVEFVAYFSETFAQYFRRGISIRDIVALVDVFNACLARAIKPSSALFHAFHTVLFDCLVMMQPRMSFDKQQIVRDCVNQLAKILERKELMTSTEKPPEFDNITVNPEARHLSVSDFKIPYGTGPTIMPSKFSFDAPTCRLNLFRLARALSIEKPILLEGAPGCGKSSTIAALASATGNKLVRLNLSDQTDVNDLFGSDIPVVLDDGGISFQWQDGPVLQAIKEGSWILLDEMNLASQSVLEGLNSCFDHRKQLYIAELNRTFDIDTRKCRFFACQNPRSQGGNRRALPKSFVNRFVSIYTEELTESDERLILEKAFPEIETDRIAQMVDINQKIRSSMDAGWQMKGAPFEFNLRDLIRWAEIVMKTSDVCLGFSLLYINRMRSVEDKAKMAEIFRSVFDSDVTDPIVSIAVSDKKFIIGPTSLDRASSVLDTELKLLPCQMSLLLKLALCVDMNWLALLVGPFNAGKRSVNLAALTGNKLHHMRLTSETDALELLGTYEQVTDFVDLERIRSEAIRIVDGFICDSSLSDLRSAEDMLDLRTSVACAVELLTDSDRKEKLQELVDELSNTCMRFEWFNSKFLDAYTNGEWIIIEDVNCCR